MNPVYYLNIIFYLGPYLFMIFHDLFSTIPYKTKQYLNGAIPLITAILCFSSLLIIGATSKGLVEMASFIPNYLLIYYLIILMTTIFVFIHYKYPGFKGTIYSFILVYISTFFWEIPENIYWQLKRGFHPTLIFTLLGVFPYIWLDKKLPWRKSTKNILLLSTVWMATLFGVFLYPSSIDCQWQPYLHPCAIFFLICRALAWFMLIYVFVIDRGHVRGFGQ